MKLKEKFIEQSLDIRYQVLEPEKFEKIADDYAIEFLNYYLHNKANHRYTFSQLSAEEALIFFKQEKQI
jgi:hypothetical protein